LSDKLVVRQISERQKVRQQASPKQTNGYRMTHASGHLVSRAAKQTERESPNCFASAHDAVKTMSPQLGFDLQPFGLLFSLLPMRYAAPSPRTPASHFIKLTRMRSSSACERDRSHKRARPVTKARALISGRKPKAPRRTSRYH